MCSFSSGCHKLTLCLLPSPVLEAKRTAAATEPVKESIIEEREGATPKAIGRLRGQKFLRAQACCLEKPFQLGQSIWLILKWKGRHLFSADGCEEAPLCHLQVGSMCAVATPAPSFLCAFLCEWRDTVSSTTAVFAYPVSVFG